jgi:hypothetical protein
MLSVTHVEQHYDKCCNAEFHQVEAYHSEAHHAESHHAESHYANSKCHCAEYCLSKVSLC